MSFCGVHLAALVNGVCPWCYPEGGTSSVYPGGDKWAAMGVTRTKPESPLRGLNVNIYDPCFAWLREQMKKVGWHLDAGVFDPEAARWYFYEDGYLILRLEHDTVDRMWAVLRGDENK